MKPQRLIFQVSLAAFLSAPTTCAWAQDRPGPQEDQGSQEIEPLDEDFLLFLAEGMEVDGDWKDPMTLASLSDLDQMPSEEIAWVAEQDETELETMTAELSIEESESRSIDGEENE